MKSYEILSPLRCAGRRWGIGSRIPADKLPALEVERLQAAGVIAATSEGSSDEGAADHLADLVAAIGQLDPETGFTRGGKPKAEALAELLGGEVSGKERDAAWAAYQEEQ